MQRFERDGAGGGLFVDLAGLLAQHGAGAVDDARRGFVERGDLAQNQPLVGHRFAHRHRRAQCANRGGAGAIDALDQLDIVLLDQVEREITLHRHRHLRQQVLRALADIEQGGFAYCLRLLRIGRVEFGGFLFQLAVERLGDVDHLLEIAHRLPQFLPFDVDRGIVHQQLVLAAAELEEDLLDMRLRALIAAEIIGQLVAEGDDAEEFARPGQLAPATRIEILDHATQFGEVGTDAFILVHRPQGAVEEAVGMTRCRHDFLAAHIGQLVDLLAEFGRIGILREQVLDETVDFLLKLALHLFANRNESGSLFRRDLRHRIGRGQLQIEIGRGFCFGRAHSCSLLPVGACPHAYDTVLVI